MRRQLVCVMVLGLVGCENLDLFRPDTGLREVSSNPFGTTTTSAQKPRANYAPASKDVANYVNTVGRKVLESNPQLAMKPVFATISHADVEIFSDGTGIVYVTEGLVRACRTEGELAAVLSIQLSKMVAERERKTPNEVRSPERLPPIDLPIGGGGQRDAADPTFKVEIAQYEKEKPRKQRGRVNPVNPGEIAKLIVSQAGYSQADLDTVAPLLQRAERNAMLESQLRGHQMQGSWQK